MLRLTGSALVADELELTALNSVVGMHSYTGRWATYDTPMDGVRRASAHAIVFQSREGTPELNCCSVNSARGFGLVSDWALLQDPEGLILNWYGPGTLKAALPACGAVTLAQTTDYPRSGRVRLTVSPTRAAEFTLKLRIPRWSRRTRVRVNGQRVAAVTAGAYLALNRRWRRGDRVDLDMDMALHFWVGAQECVGKTSIYRGPLLLAYDRRFNTVDPDDIPALDTRRLAGRMVQWKGRIPPVVLLRFKGVDGRALYLCDFGSAGEGGTPYRSWLPMAHAGPDLPQYFASSADDLFAARLQRYGFQYRQYLEMKTIAGWESWIKPTQLLDSLRALETGRPQLLADRDRARALIAAAPDAAQSRKLRRVLQDLEQGVNMLAPAFEDVLRREDAEVRAQFKIPVTPAMNP